ncbi:nucleotide-diphospho-sugar transferase [Irpex rosettiformis]|uniref:Nucleotide-diphospho-sugar transferase n=1 Tax=Irpex rosettiformis TaxID=378272 RepID=A0ACB8U9B5_9APHY|nr:nucleotide-diphospho-sugar transferase [Irpex rosettiformis]
MNYLLSRFFNLHRQYVLLGTEDPEKPVPVVPRRRRRQALVLILIPVILLGSIIANIVFAVKLGKQPTRRPLDNYQHINTFPIASPRVATSGQNAIVTTLYNDGYVSAVATLGHSLQKANSTARLIVLYFPSAVSPQSLCLASSSGWHPVPVTRIAPPQDGKGINIHFADQFTKLSLWSLDKIGIESLVYLDADTLVLRNFDELFQLPFAFAAAPDVWGDQRGMTLEFNAGVLFLKPNSDVYNHLLEVLPHTRFPMEFAEQAFLNQYFAGRTLTLPPVYNGNLAMKTRYPVAWEGLKDEMRVYHYTMVKPFLTKSYKGLSMDEVILRAQASEEDYHGAYREEVVMWEKMWEEMWVNNQEMRERCSRV